MNKSADSAAADVAPHPPRLSAVELCQALGIESDTLKAWLRRGLPSQTKRRRRQFDVAAVRAWLIDQDLAEVSAPPEPVCNTREQVAAAFGVSTRTVSEWMAQGMPGRAGRPGCRDGWFPMAQIDAWLSRRRLDPTTPDDSRAASQARQTKARAMLLELDYQQRLGQLVSADEVSRTWSQHIFEAKAQLDQIAGRVLKRLPDGLPPDLRNKVRKDVERVARRAYEALQHALIAAAEQLEQQAADE